MEEKKDTSCCLNCAAPKEQDGSIFCAYCGQKHGTGKVSLKEIFAELVSNIFNLDSKTIRTAAALFFPGKLTQEYFQGRHKSYSHPIRMFFVSAIFFFAAVTFSLGDRIGSGNQITKSVDLFLEKSKTVALLDSLKIEVAKDFSDSLAIKAMDSLVLKVDNSYEMISFDTSSFNVSGFEIVRDSIFANNQYIRPDDIRNSSASDLVEKYWEDATFFKKIMLRQAIKMVKDNSSWLSFMLGKVPIMLLFMMPFLALFLKILYYRRKRFFVEHLFFSFHLHAFVFFLGTFLILVGIYLPGNLTLIIGLSIFVYLFVAMKKVYGQSFFKTLIKYLLLLFFYALLAIFFLVFFSFISFLLF